MEYYGDEVNDILNEIVANRRLNNNKTTTRISFKYKTKIIGRTLLIIANNNTLDAEVVVPLKYSSNFWRSLNLPLINCKIQLDLS